jgi:hypothetical protein
MASSAAEGGEKVCARVISTINSMMLEHLRQRNAGKNRF